ncbi:TRAP transporter small permease [Blastococcus goldschmidtiae]|uniref:TRAP transporter small permease n=1 Tax=Blastococcus goldschmidtiae TaxID=3075546 RepID=A0ABU2K860_9ACTN|nr:TRAP transporter small permease [Blastococcus sp. DSM 46792]MDT0276367.1 TRAP transporter small permease [Blastococcus sp. DSM 46792]
MSPTRVIDRVSQGLAGIAAAVLLVMLVVTVGNVVLRLVATPYYGTVEVVTFLAVAVNGLALAEAQRTRSHIAIDLFMNKAPARIQLVVGAVITLVSAALFILLAQQLVSYGLNLKDQGALSDSLRLPYWPFSLILAVGIAGLALALISDLLSIGRNLRSDMPESIW